MQGKCEDTVWRRAKLVGIFLSGICMHTKSMFDLPFAGRAEVGAWGKKYFAGADTPLKMCSPTSLIFIVIWWLFFCSFYEKNHDWGSCNSLKNPILQRLCWGGFIKFSYVLIFMCIFLFRAPLWYTGIQIMVHARNFISKLVTLDPSRIHLMSLKTQI